MGPSLMPSMAPTDSVAPSKHPSDVPTQSVDPSSTPSINPSISVDPSSEPSVQPSVSLIPSADPSIRLSEMPSSLPSATNCELANDCTVAGNRGIRVNENGAGFKSAIASYLQGSGSGSEIYGRKIACWDVSAVTNMFGAFDGQITFDEPLCWDVSSVTNMQSMFENTEAFNQDLSAWDVSSVTTMKFMFYGADAFNRDLSAWDVSSVTTIRAMFYGASDFNQNLCAWASKSPQLGLLDSDVIFTYSSCPHSRSSSAVPVRRSGTSADPHDGPFCFTC
eukprot:scaffold278245_cov75-Attheya_sp.AAC.2